MDIATACLLTPLINILRISILINMSSHLDAKHLVALIFILTLEDLEVIVQSKEVHHMSIEFYSDEKWKAKCESYILQCFESRRSARLLDQDHFRTSGSEYSVHLHLG